MRVTAGREARLAARLLCDTGRIAEPEGGREAAAGERRGGLEHPGGHTDRGEPTSPPSRGEPVAASRPACATNPRAAAGADPVRIEIERLQAAAADDATLIERITVLTNDVYAVAEDGLWAEGTTRTTPDEVAELTRAGQLAVARLGGRIIGCIRVQRLDEHTGEFGMLTADPACRGIGVGRELVRFAERTCRAEGVRTMQLELLVPRGWRHPTKEFLAGWYTRAGYRVVRTGTIDEAYPALAPHLTTPCDFVIYHRNLDADTH